MYIFCLSIFALTATETYCINIYTSAKTPEMRGKGSAGDLSCRGARGTLSGGQCEGDPCLSLFPKEVGGLGTSLIWRMRCLISIISSDLNGTQETN